MELTIQVATAVGTVGAVVVALFGSWLRAHLAPPKLVLGLKDVRGSKTPFRNRNESDGGDWTTESRWYHLLVENRRHWSPVHGVRVFLLRMEEPDAAGQDRIKWLGSIPMKWRHQEVHPFELTIGASADCDLFSVVKEKWIELQPLIAPNSLEVRRNSECRFTVTLQARGVEADSDFLRVRIIWNGKWSDDTEEMGQHLVIEEIRS